MGMTTKEAIKVLRTESVEIGGNAVSVTRWLTAFDVAIKALDAVPVVRCRECKFGDWDSEPDDAMVCVRTKDGFWRSGNDFCSRGKRKEGVD